LTYDNTNQSEFPKCLILIQIIAIGDVSLPDIDWQYLLAFLRNLAFHLTNKIHHTRQPGCGLKQRSRLIRREPLVSV
jgi:hypothetical protein